MAVLPALRIGKGAIVVGGGGGGRLKERNISIVDQLTEIHMRITIKQEVNNIL